MIGATLSSEIMNMVLPKFPRRSTALEGSWEARWRRMISSVDHSQANDQFAAPFLNLWEEGLPGPALVLNTTSITGGDQILVSNLRTDWSHPRGPCQANIAERIDLPLSAAVNASARFPIVEDWGWFAIPQNSKIGRDGCDNFEGITDGGFFDNYGAVTALEAYRHVKSLIADKPKKPRILVVQITSDWDCSLARILDGEDGRKAECDEAIKKRKQELDYREPKGGLFSAQRQEAVQFNAFRFTRTFLYGIPAPDAEPGLYQVAMQSRAINGVAVATQLRDHVGPNSYYHFSLAGAFDSPLGWVLSRHAREQISGVLDGGLNEREMTRLMRDLTTE